MKDEKCMSILNDNRLIINLDTDCYAKGLIMSRFFK